MFFVEEVYPYNSKKARVKLDNGFTFALYKGEIRKYHIKEEEAISTETFHEIYHMILMKRARERALYLLKNQPKTERQIQDKLKSEYYDQTIVDDVLTFLKKYSYVDDYTYAENYIEQNCNRKSMMQIQSDLITKGVDKSLIQDIFEGQGMTDDYSIDRLIQKKINHYNLNESKDRQRLFAMLMRKGYRYDTIISAVERFRLLDITSF